MAYWHQAEPTRNLRLAKELQTYESRRRLSQSKGKKKKRMMGDTVESARGGPALKEPGLGAAEVEFDEMTGTGETKFTAVEETLGLSSASSRSISYGGEVEPAGAVAIVVCEADE